MTRSVVSLLILGGRTREVMVKDEERLAEVKERLSLLKLAKGCVGLWPCAVKLGVMDGSESVKLMPVAPAEVHLDSRCVRVLACRG